MTIVTTHTTMWHIVMSRMSITITMAIATMHTLILTMGMTTHRIVMNRMSNTATKATLILTKTMTMRRTTTTLIPTTLTAIIMARVSPSRRSRPRRLGSWWRR